MGGTLTGTHTSGQAAPRTATKTDGYASPNRLKASAASMMGMPSKDFSVNFRKIWTRPSATAVRTRPGLSPHSSPETKTLLSMTALTLAALRPHRVNLGLNLIG